MANTTNFGWETPDDTDLVKDGAAAMRTLGNAIDTSFVDLKGGTSGQVLAKASNTDLDFSWVAQDDSNAIQNAIVDAKGDLISATAADTPARLAVGTNGQVLTADSAESTGLKWTTLSSGGFTELASGTLSGSSVSITSISQSYVDLYLQIVNPYTSGGAVINFTTNSYTTNTYGGNWINNSTASGSSSQTAGNFVLGSATSTDYNMYDLTIRNYTSANRHVMSFHAARAQQASNNAMGAWTNQDNSAVTSIQIFPASGSWSGGTYKLYGVK